jgi:low temperature requirement protein LtrA
LAFVGVKEGLLDLVAIQNRTDTVYNTVTVTTLAAITYAALKVTDVSFVLAFAGATLGNALIYVFPTIMFRGTVGKMTNASAKLKREAKLAPLIAAAGIVMGAIGGSMAIKSLG